MHGISMCKNALQKLRQGKGRSREEEGGGDSALIKPQHARNRHLGNSGIQ